MNRVITLILGCLVSFTLHAETYVVCVGIGNYADSKIQNLAKTEGDAKAMAEFYKKGTQNVIAITGKYATKAQIIKSLNSQFARAKAEDKIVFYFSGHGYQGGFCPYDYVDIGGGLSYIEVLRIMNASKAKTKIIFADACHSGAIRNNSQSTQPKADNVLMFLSSRGNEQSAESPFMANGIFTKYLLQGLSGKADANKDRRINARELFNYVSSGVKSKTKNQQHPVMWGKFDNNLTIVEYRKK